MRIGFGLELRQQQKQLLAPRMIQSMEILQLPILELQERIEKELQENPILEMREEDPDLPEEPVEREDSDAPTMEEKTLVVNEKDDNNVADFERMAELDSQVPEYFDDSPRVSSGRMEEDSDRKHDAMSNVASRSESLHEHLEGQLGELDLDEELRQMCERIITSLDTNGYLAASVEDLLPPDADPKQIELAHKALAMVQKLEPAGVGARDLRECLLLQLTPRMRMYEEIKTLVEGHLEDLRDNRLPHIQKKTHYSIETIHEAWDEMRKLHPKPGSEFNVGFVPTVKPDVLVDRDENGEWRVQLEDGRTPSLRISEYYRSRLMSEDATVDEKNFIKRKINSAQWLIESIEQRRSTLLRVTQAILERQKRFLEEGPESLEPLRMAEVAEKVGVHVTTVSRAVDDKWMQTPRGLFALRKFFIGGTLNDDGEEVAWDAIRVKLQEIVEKEDKKNPLSDDDLVALLKNTGLNVARRTVTKYRQKMNIPSSRHRRDWTT